MELFQGFLSRSRTLNLQFAVVYCQTINLHVIKVSNKPPELQDHLDSKLQYYLNQSRVTLLWLIFLHVQVINVLFWRAEYGWKPRVMVPTGARQLVVNEPSCSELMTVCSVHSARTFMRLWRVQRGQSSRMDGSCLPLRMKECFHLEQRVEDSVAQVYTKPIRGVSVSYTGKNCNKKMLGCSLGTVCSIDVLFLTWL